MNGGRTARLDGKKAHVEGEPHDVHDDEKPRQKLGARRNRRQVVLLAVVENSTFEEDLPLEVIEGICFRLLEQQCFLFAPIETRQMF